MHILIASHPLSIPTSTRHNHTQIPNSPRSRLHHTPKNLLALPQLHDLMLIEITHTLRGDRLRNHGLNSEIRELGDDERLEEVFETRDDVAFDDLSGDVCDEGFLLDLGRRRF